MPNWKKNGKRFKETLYLCKTTDQAKEEVILPFCAFSFRMFAYVCNCCSSANGNFRLLVFRYRMRLVFYTAPAFHQGVYQGPVYE